MKFTLFRANQQRDYGHHEGWGLFCIGFEDKRAIQKLDTSAGFESDAAALAFVRQRAAEGSWYHQGALAWLAGEVK